jgi:hypothetical protein
MEVCRCELPDRASGRFMRLVLKSLPLLVKCFTQFWI